VRSEALHYRHLAHLAFPDDFDMPAERAKRSIVATVAKPVVGDLGGPVFGVGLRCPASMRAGVAMPETAVNEDRGAASGGNNVWAARQTFHMKAIPKSKRMQRPTDSEFWRSILTPHRAHQGGCGGGGRKAF
jgi:hypothetical protein